MTIVENIASVRARMHAATRRAQRESDQVQLMAVSKTFPPAAIREVYAAGIRIFGENRVQEFSEKVKALRDLPAAEWHLIGHLQTNKASKSVELFSSVDSVDSLRLAEKLDSAAKKLNKRLPILIEVNVGGESQKTGVGIGVDEVAELLSQVSELGYLEVRGLMTVPPFTEEAEGARPFFRTLRQLRDQVAGRQIPGARLDVLSMGMSHDFEIAIEEGSTCVRIGSAIFGERKKE